MSASNEPPEPARPTAEDNLSAGEETWRTVLDIERAEVRHWHNSIAQATFWFIAGMFALTGFFISQGAPNQYLAFAVVVAIAALAFFYVVLAYQAFVSMMGAGRNVVRVQKRLRLHEPAERAVYRKDQGEDWKEKWTPPRYLIWLICMAALLAIANCLAVIGKSRNWW